MSDQEPLSSDIDMPGPTRSGSPRLGVRMSWWNQWRESMAGWSRFISHSMIVASGLGFGAQASWPRILTGAVGVSASVFMGIFGKKNEEGEKKSSLSFVERIRPRNVARKYYAALSLSAVCLMADGCWIGSWSEFLAGIWAAPLCGIAALASEKQNGEKIPTVNPLAVTRQDFKDLYEQIVHYAEYPHHLGTDVPQWVHRQMQYFKESPKQFAADMLQFSAALAIADGFSRKDMARIIGGFCLGFANFAGHTMRDDSASAKGRG